MIFAAAFLLAVVFSLPLVAPRLRGGPRARTDLLAPARVTAVFHLVTIVPYLILVGFDEQVMEPLVRQNADVGELEPAVLWYAAVQALGFLALWQGTRSRRARRLASALPVIATDFRPARRRAAVAFALVTAGLGFAVFLAQVGGFDVLVRSLDRRTALTAGAGYVLALLNLLFFGIAIGIASLRDRRSPLAIAALSALALGSAVAFSSLGGRKATILIVVAAVFTWHYAVRPIRRLRLRHALPLALLVPYFVVMPILRAPGGVDYFSRNPGALVGEIWNNVETAVTDLSYVDTYLYVTSSFGSDELWWGATYLDLLSAPVPSTIDPFKPPLDDGVYIRTRAGGMRAEPGMAFKQMFYSSWPPETLGATFMNFGVVGVAIGMYLLGAVYRLAYAYMQRSRFTLYSILLYAHFVVSFHLSNLRIVQAVVYVALTTVFFGAFFGLRRRSLASSGPGRQAAGRARDARTAGCVGASGAAWAQAPPWSQPRWGAGLTSQAVAGGSGPLGVRRPT